MSVPLLSGWRRLARTIGASALLLLAVPALTFVLFDVIPADPARVALGPNASVEAVKALRAQLGLDRPATERLLTQYGRLLTFNWGRSLSNQRLVAVEVGEKFGLSARIGFLACLISAAVSYGVVLVVFRFPLASILIALLRSWVALPSYVTATSVALGLAALFPSVPLSGYAILEGGFAGFLVPATLAALYPTAVLSSVLHGRVDEASRMSHFRAARAWGMSWMPLFHRAALRPSAAVWLTSWMNQAGLVFFTTFLIEVIFSIPGVGTLLLRAVQAKDFPLLQGIVMANAIFFVVISGATQTLIRLLDPRVETL